MSELIQITVPDQGLEDQPVRLNLWLIAIGDEVSSGDTVAELSLPGILLPVVAPARGTLDSITVHAGTLVSAGQTIGVIRVAES